MQAVVDSIEEVVLMVSIVTLCRYQMEEMRVNAETAHLENQKLRAEIAEMTGDDMRAASTPREVTSSSESTSSASPPPPVPSEATTSSSKRDRRISTGAEGGSTSSRSAAAAAKALNVSGRRSEIEEDVAGLKELLTTTLGMSLPHFPTLCMFVFILLCLFASIWSRAELPQNASEMVLAWAQDFTDAGEDWFQICEVKFLALEQVSNDSKKRIKDLETQRSRFEKDLEIRTEKVMQQQLEMEILRSTPESQDALQLMTGREQYQMKSLQVRRLVFTTLFQPVFTGYLAYSTTHSNDWNSLWPCTASFSASSLL